MGWKTEMRNIISKTNELTAETPDISGIGLRAYFVGTDAINFYVDTTLDGSVIVESSQDGTSWNESARFSFEGGTQRAVDENGDVKAMPGIQISTVERYRYRARITWNRRTNFTLEYEGL